MRTLIKARYVVGFQNGGHALLENGHVLIEGDRIMHVGRGWDGQADRTINGADKLLIPGFMPAPSGVWKPITFKTVFSHSDSAESCRPQLRSSVVGAVGTRCRRLG
jgi:hypothetical protein